jgi:hypothetical protein
MTYFSSAGEEMELHTVEQFSAQIVGADCVAMPAIRNDCSVVAFMASPSAGSLAGHNAQIENDRKAIGGTP